MTKQEEFRPGRGYSKRDWDEVESPELTPAQIRQGRPFAEAFPDLAASIKRTRGPQRKPKKVLLTLRLDPDAVEAFRSTGAGWQVRIGEAVAKAAVRLKKTSAASRAKKTA